jgi:hypothetical protein
MCVDSLCIPQNSPADWAEEAAKMSDVHRNRLLTIAAPRASNKDQGLFACRDPLVCTPCYIFKDSKGTSIYTHPLEGRLFLDTWNDKTALHRRGWVLEERILSPRTLNFGTSLVWECRQELLSEFGIQQKHLDQEQKPTVKAALMILPLPIKNLGAWIRNRTLYFHFSGIGIL